MKISKMFQIGAAAFLLSGAAMAGPVDLSSWADEGNGTWTKSADNNSVIQSSNGEPTVFYNQVNSQGLALSGEITVEQTSGDDDFIGFVLGYNAGDLTNASADYILIDWKQADQYWGPYGGIAKAGLAISRVTGELNNTDAWLHSTNVEELQRANNTGWVNDETYSFELIFTATQIQVSVNGNVELDITGTFNNGSFGFYNYSQDNVLYAGIEESVVSAVPVPAALFMFAPALLGFMGLRRKAKATIA